MLAQLGQDKNIEILTRAQVLESRPVSDGYVVRIRQKPRYVDSVRCVGCGLCEAKCPASNTVVSSFYDKKRVAIYQPAVNGIPRGYVVDEAACLFFKDGSCRICERLCPKGAIDLGASPKEMAIEVQGVILAPGASPFNPTALSRYGYGALKDVVTTIEFEALINPGGVTGGRIVRPSDGTSPKRIAWIQCVGSRQTNPVNRPYCSSVCCTVSIKQALVARQLIRPAPDTDIYFIDIMAHQKGAERYYQCAQESGVRFVNSRPSGVILKKSGGLAIETYSQADGRRTREYDLVVLSVGLEAGRGIKELAQIFGIETDCFGFNMPLLLGAEHTSAKRIFACGTFNGPKSIQGSVIEGSAAAAHLRCALGQGLMEIPQKRKESPQKMQSAISLSPVRIGIFVCSCGTNISEVIDVEALVGLLEKEGSSAVHIEALSFACAPDGANLISKAIREKGLNRVVIAACSPRSHEPIFRHALQQAGLHPSLLVIANIREQVAWAHWDNPYGGLERAKDQIIMAIKKAEVLSPVEIREYPVTRSVLVLGGGVTGMSAAAILAESGVKVYLVEKAKRLGGNALSLLETWRGRPVAKIVRGLERRLRRNPLVRIFLNSTVEELEGYTGNFTSYIKEGTFSARLEPVVHGALVVATGAKESTPVDYLYGNHPAILTHQELDRLLLKDGVAGFKKGQSVVFIQCVGSCSDKRPYCSRVCCTHSVKRAIFLKEKFPHLDIHVLYTHMRTYGQRDHFYRQAMEMGIKFSRFHLDNPPKVSIVTELDRQFRPAQTIRVEFFHELLQSKRVLHPDFLILASAIEADAQGNDRLSKLLKVPLGTDGFFQEMHLKLRPCELRRDGFFVAGLAHYPKEVEESMSQAAAAAGKTLAFLSQEKVRPDKMTARLLVHRCDGCGLCLDACPEKALTLCQFVFQGEVKHMAEVDESLCTGCGACTAVCPKDGIGVPGYMPDEITAQIKALLRICHGKS